MAIASLSPARRAASVLATLQRSATATELSAILGRSAACVRDDLADAIAGGRVHREVVGRRNIYTAVDVHPDEAERAFAARAIATWMERSGRVPAAVVADGWLAAGREARAAAFLEAAGIEAELRGDDATAITLLERAGALQRDAEKRTALVRRIAAVERRCGRFASAEGRLVRLLEPSPAPANARAALDLAELRLDRGDPDEALAVLAHARRGARDQQLQAEVRLAADAVHAARGTPRRTAHAPYEREPLRLRYRRALAQARTLRLGGAPRAAALVARDALASADDGTPRCALELEAMRALVWIEPLAQVRAFAAECVDRARACGDATAAAVLALEAAYWAVQAGDRLDAQRWLRGRPLHAHRSADEPTAMAIALLTGGQAAPPDEDLVAAVERAALADDLERLGAAVADASPAPYARTLVERFSRALPHDVVVPRLAAAAARLRTASRARLLLGVRRAAESEPATLLDAVLACAAASERACRAEERRHRAEEAATAFSRFGWSREAAYARSLAGSEPQLSPRLAAIAQLAAAGRTNAQIASQLGISAHTVQHHVSAVLRELGLRSRWQLADREALPPR